MNVIEIIDRIEENKGDYFLSMDHSGKILIGEPERKNNYGLIEISVSNDASIQVTLSDGSSHRTSLPTSFRPSEPEFKEIALFKKNVALYLKDVAINAYQLVNKERLLQNTLHFTRGHF